VHNDITSNYYGISPTLWFSSALSTDTTGSGTYASPYALSLLPVPTLTLTSPNGDQHLDFGETLTLKGTTSSDYEGGEIIINLKVYDQTQSQVIKIATASSTLTTPVTNGNWEINLNYNDLINLGNSFSHLKITATLDQGLSEASILYPGTLTLTAISDIFSNLANALNLRFAGQIYYPFHTQMTTPGQIYDGYTYLTTIDQNHQIWTKPLLSHPQAATSSATQVYPFLVKFFNSNPKLGEIELVE
jgi:hypothetical protein